MGTRNSGPTRRSRAAQVRKRAMAGTRQDPSRDDANDFGPKRKLTASGKARMARRARPRGGK